MSTNSEIVNRVAEWQSLSDAAMMLRCGEMSAQEIRTVRAVLNSIMSPTRSRYTGADLIAEERQRQIVQEGWTPEHDDRHDTALELVAAAKCYLEPPYCRFLTAAKNTRGENIPLGWPFEHDSWKPGSVVRDLVKAGALIAAEIDRHLRAGHT